MCNEVARSENRRPRGSGLSFFAIRRLTKLHHETIIKVRSGLFSFVLILLIKQKCVKSVCVNCCLYYQRQPQAACTPEGCSVCNEVAPSENRRSRGSGASFFAIRWRAKLHPEAIIKVRSGLFNFVLLFLIKQKCVKSVCVNCCLFIRGSRRLPVPRRV